MKMSMKTLINSLIVMFLTVRISYSQQNAFEELLIYSDEKNQNIEIPQPKKVQQIQQTEQGFIEAQQWIPPNNDEPGFEWPEEKATYKSYKSMKEMEEDEYFIVTGSNGAFFKINDMPAETLGPVKKCFLQPNTRYTLKSNPDFYGEDIIVEILNDVPGCPFQKGYINMDNVFSHSAGGACQLPPTVRAFLDTIAYAEGTETKYNYIFTFATFKSYKDHPRQRRCQGRLCSDAAGRYQFLSKTWDALAEDLGLKDFTPPNQDKAVMEIIRRAGAYKEVLNSSNYQNFSNALRKLNTIWASLPGSPYGQPTHPAKELWQYYKTRLAVYK